MCNRDEIYHKKISIIRDERKKIMLIFQSRSIEVFSAIEVIKAGLPEVS